MAPALAPEALQSAGVLAFWALLWALVSAWVLTLPWEAVATLLVAEEL